MVAGAGVAAEHAELDKLVSALEGEQKRQRLLRREIRRCQLKLRQHESGLAQLDSSPFEELTCSRARGMRSSVLAGLWPQVQSPSTSNLTSL